MISSPQMSPVQTYQQLQPAQGQAPQALAPQQAPQAITPPPAMGPTASAVNIQIFNPQAYGSAAPVANPTAQYYNAIPQGSVYAPQQNAPAAFIPQTPVAYPAPVVSPAPNVMPGSVIEQPAVSQPAVQEPVKQIAGQQPAAEPPVQAPEAAPQPPKDIIGQPGVDIAGLNAKLTSPDLNAQTDGIVEIAQLCDQGNELSKQVVDDGIMASLAGIIAADTSALQGPSQEQINVAIKEQNGEQLTPEEQQIAQQSSPKEIAEKNKVYAMYTLAMMQKQLRDEIDEYNAQNAQNPVPQLEMQNMTGFNEIVNTINTTQVPLVKAAGIEALGYVASKPEDKAVLDSTVLAYANDPDPAVQQAVGEVYAKIGSPIEAQAPQAQPQQEAAPVQEGKKKHKLFHKKDKVQK